MMPDALSSAFSLMLFLYTYIYKNTIYRKIYFFVHSNYQAEFK